MNRELHRKQLTELLKKCRARSSPAEMGLPDQGRRRTPGLRREDVAALAGVSVTWYTWLEQARDIKVSADVLDRVSSTLRMSTEERDYLFALVQHRPPPNTAMTDGQMSPTLQRMLDRLSVPAFVKTARWDIIGWNDLAVKVFRDYGQLPPERRNLLRLLLVDDESYRADPEVHQTTARRILAKFRVDYSQYRNDGSFDELIETLKNESLVFRQLWDSSEVINRSEAVAYHPQHGGMWFEHSSYVPEGSPTLRMMIFVPHDEETSAKLDALSIGAAPRKKKRI
jgi:transcriptional regulator with XRE-family HTH domain